MTLVHDTNPMPDDAPHVFMFKLRATQMLAFGAALEDFRLMGKRFEILELDADHVLHIRLAMDPLQLPASFRKAAEEANVRFHGPNIPRREC